MGISCRLVPGLERLVFVWLCYKTTPQTSLKLIDTKQLVSFSSNVVMYNISMPNQT